ncbi:hypothetical protein V6Z11_D11G211200 [Gossypium hirsutum]
MKEATLLQFLLGIIVCSTLFFCTNAEDPYLFYTWEVTYGTRAPLGVPQQVILINNQFPGPPIEAVTNNNIVVNVINHLDEPFLITWHGIMQRRTSWQDGVLGTNCPIPPHSNWTYKFQVKDQIGTFMYYPSTLMHRASGGFGAFNINQRSVISIPYPAFDEDVTLLVGDWYIKGHKALQKQLDSGLDLPLPDGLLINGGSQTPPSLPLPVAPTYHVHWSMKHARTIRMNLTANAARPNPQGSFHYGAIKVVRTILLANEKVEINDKLRYAVNGISYVDPATPLKLADWFNIPGVFVLNGTKDAPPSGPPTLGVSVFGLTLHDFVEIVFQNTEKTIQSWHLDGYNFFVAGYVSIPPWIFIYTHIYMVV